MSTFEVHVLLEVKHIILKGRKSILFSLMLFISISVNGQNGKVEIGAKAAGTGYAYTAVSDEWSIFYNPAGIDGLVSSNALFSVENKFNIEGLNSIGAAFVTNLPLGSFGASVFRFGDNIFREQHLSIAYGNSFGITSLGLRINYLQFSAESTETRSNLTFDFGGITSLNEQVHFGAFIRNLSQSKIANESDRSIPVILNAGISYLPTPQLMINAEIEKDIDFDPGIRLGLEYAFIKKLKVRAGVLTYPYTNFFGLGLVTHRLDIDYSITLNPNLGVNNQASVSYQLKKK